MVMSQLVKSIMNILIKISYLLLIISILSCSTKSSIISNETKQNISYQKNIELTRGIKCNIYSEQTNWLDHADRIARIANINLNEVSKTITPSKSLVINIILINNDSFKRNITDSHWVKAAFYNGKIYIPVKNPSTQFSEESLSKTLKHEITHVVTHDLSNGNIPAWLDEGLALLIENQPEPKAEKRYKEWLRLNKPIPLENLETGFTKLHFDQASYAYIQSKLMVNYIMKKYGRTGLQVLVENFAKYKTAPNTFNQTFGISLEQFEEQFENKIKFAINSGLI
jgi:hypothetical protein